MRHRENTTEENFRWCFSWAGFVIECAVLRIDAHSAGVGGAECGNVEGGESVGGFCVGMPITIVAPGADQREGRLARVVKRSVPAVFAAVVRHEDEICRLLPGNLVQRFRSGVAGEKRGEAVVFETRDNLVAVFAAIFGRSEQIAVELRVAEAKCHRLIHRDNLGVAEIRNERLPFVGGLRVRRCEQLFHVEIAQNVRGAADVVKIAVAEHERGDGVRAAKAQILGNGVCAGAGVKNKPAAVGCLISAAGSLTDVDHREPQLLAHRRAQNDHSETEDDGGERQRAKPARIEWDETESDEQRVAEHEQPDGGLTDINMERAGELVDDVHQRYDDEDEHTHRKENEGAERRQESSDEQRHQRQRHEQTEKRHDEQIHYC